MLSEYQSFAIGQMGWALWASVGASAGYVVAAVVFRDKAQLLMTLPGLAVLAAIAFAVGIAPWTDAQSLFSVAMFVVFTGLLILALGLDFSAMYARSGCTVADVLQFLLLPSIPWVWFIGIFVIGHDWP
ncbi:MAG TPA: hypothetical protein VJ727_03555 [Rhodanobacteraceae bacterium]|nr:hypothetical protein [Rhodanobacteraceae bacterium]